MLKHPPAWTTPERGADVDQPTETLRYTYRLRPGKQAEAALLAEWGRCRWLWNEAVHQQQSGRKPTSRKLGMLLTEARGAYGWLRAGSRAAQSSTLRNYVESLNQSFTVKGCRRPKIKRAKATLPSLPYSSCNGFSINNGRLCVAKTPPIPVVWHREMPSEPTSLRVYRDSLGHWYASFVVRREVETLPETTGAIGIDWGVTATATTTDPAYDLPYAGHAKAAADNLVRYQRRMSRRAPKPGQKGSKGYQRAKRDTAKLHKRVARQRQHTARVWAKAVVADHQVIAVGDLRPQFLSRSTMARKAADAAIGTTKATLVEFGRRAGRTVVLVPPAYTTMTCSECATRAKSPLGLGVRTFVCGACGFVADRDRNAAQTILNQAERILAGADDVRHRADHLSGLVGPVRSEPESPRL